MQPRPHALSPLAFNERPLRKVIARVFEDNDASMRVLEKLGFGRRDGSGTTITSADRA